MKHERCIARVGTVLVAMVTLAFAVGLPAQQGTTHTSSSLLGTWQFVSVRFGTNQPPISDFAKDERSIKLITDTHFTFVEYDTGTKRVKGTAGGRYTLAGDTYTESIDFTDSGMQRYLGRKRIFRFVVDAQKLTLFGTADDGQKLEETWLRVK